MRLNLIGRIIALANLADEVITVISVSAGGDAELRKASKR
jgi:hypothetical protein